MSKSISWAFLAAFLFGMASPISKILLVAFSPFQLAGVLYLGAALGVGLLLLIRHESFGLKSELNRRNQIRLGLAIFFGGVMGPLFLLKGLQIAAAGSVSLWLILEMVFTAVLGVVLFKDHLGTWGWMGVAGCFMGSSLLALGGGSVGFKAGGWVALACLCWAFDNHLSALIDGLKPLQSTFWKGLTAGSVNLLIGILAAPFHPEIGFIFGAVVIGALSYGASIALYIHSAQVLGATRSQMTFSTAPVFGLGISFFFLHESLTGLHGAAALLFAVSLFLLFRDKHSHVHSHESLLHLHEHKHDDGHHNHEHPGELPSLKHTHSHQHEPLVHSHPHLPDLHHRHAHHSD